MKNTNRARAIAYRASVAEYLGTELGLGDQISARPYLVRLSDQLAEGYEQGQILGLADVLINVHVDLTFEVARQVERSRAEAEMGDKSIYFSVQQRNKATFFSDPSSSLVFTSAECMVTIIQRLLKLAAYEKEEAATDAAEVTPAAAA